MKTPIIDAIFGDYAPTEEYAKFYRSLEIERAEKAVLAAMKDRCTGEDLVNMLTACIERRLFTMGFRYAVKLMCECGAVE